MAEVGCSASSLAFDAKLSVALRYLGRSGVTLKPQQREVIGNICSGKDVFT